VCYLLDSYAVAISPGLVLTEATPTDVRDARALVMGSAEARSKQPALIHVREEIEGVKTVFGKERVTVLPDAEFSVANVKEVMRDRPYNIVHFATHAKFSGGISESWIQAYDRNIYWSDLEELMGYRRFTERPVELLVLSACETAEGSLDAVLGLSGIALRAGARSVVGTLWEPFDFAAAKLIPAFYREWSKSNTSKAEALRRAQRTLIKDKEYDLSHPAFWSPFVIIGNWL
jgi:CHAT domain-containing protein